MERISNLDHIFPTQADDTKTNILISIYGYRSNGYDGKLFTKMNIIIIRHRSHRSA
jgi:hypothetical protein